MRQTLYLIFTLILLISCSVDKETKNTHNQYLDAFPNDIDRGVIYIYDDTVLLREIQKSKMFQSDSDQNYFLLGEVSYQYNNSGKLISKTRYSYDVDTFTLSDSLHYNYYYNDEDSLKREVLLNFKGDTSVIHYYEYRSANGGEVKIRQKKSEKLNSDPDTISVIHINSSDKLEKKIVIGSNQDTVKSEYFEYDEQDKPRLNYALNSNKDTTIYRKYIYKADGSYKIEGYIMGIYDYFEEYHHENGNIQKIIYKNSITGEIDTIHYSYYDNGLIKSMFWSN